MICAEKYSKSQVVPDMEGVLKDGVARKQDMVNSQKGCKEKRNVSGDVFGDQTAKTSNGDGGSLRWNSSLMSHEQHAKNHPSSSPAISKKVNMRDHRKMNQSEESLRTVLFLSCWGPN
ncbi:Wound-responsive family protein [Senna tora]|uniref:Wound-responsive family protein n=1 Tax=Senna tora TaxID=362788 RepID=A0A834SKA3_9FABA|nr:Wound-responsive family protein [Senna tora]